MIDPNKSPDWSPSIEWTWRLYRMALAFIHSEKTPWFFLGMATEGLGLGFQSLMGWPAYPTLDFVVGAVIGMFLLYWQKSHPQEEK